MPDQQEDVKPDVTSASEESSVDVKEETTEAVSKEELEALKVKYEREKELRQYERERRKAVERERQPKESEASAPDIDAIVEEKLSKFQRAQQESIMSEVLNSLSDDEDERELIRLKYENELKPSGFTREKIEADLKNAWLLANRSRYEAIIAEKTKAKVQKGLAEAEAMKRASVSSTGGSPIEESGPQLSSAEEKFLKYFGATDRYKSRLKNK